MLLYVFGAIIFLAAAFGYANQDHAKSFDNGEKAAAGWMIGYHNAMRQSCGRALDCSTADGVATLLPKDTTYQPAYLLKQDANPKLWLGVQTVSYNTILFSFYEKTAEDGLASRGRNLSLPNIGARLFEASADFPDGTDLWTGRYSAAANAVFVSNGFTTQSASGVLDEQHTQSSGAGPLSGVVDAPPTVIPVNFAAAGIPIADGAPVILSPVPCKGGLGQCLGPVATGAGDPTTRPTGELTNGGSLPLTEPPGGRPATPPAPDGGASWDPGHGGTGTVVSTPAGSIKPVLDTGECPPV